MPYSDFQEIQRRHKGHNPVDGEGLSSSPSPLIIMMQLYSICWFFFKFFTYDFKQIAR